MSADEAHRQRATDYARAEESHVPRKPEWFSSGATPEMRLPHRNLPSAFPFFSRSTTVRLLLRGTGLLAGSPVQLRRAPDSRRNRTSFFDRISDPIALRKHGRPLPCGPPRNEPAKRMSFQNRVAREYAISCTSPFYSSLSGNAQKDYGRNNKLWGPHPVRSWSANYFFRSIIRSKRSTLADRATLTQATESNRANNIALI